MDENNDTPKQTKCIYCGTKIGVHPETMDNHLRRKCTQLDELLLVVDKIDETLRTLEENGSIGRVLVEWIGLERYYRSHTDSQFILQSLENRFQLIKHPIFAAAYILDPRWRDKQINYIDYQDGEKLISKLAGDNWNTVNSQLKIFFTYGGPFTKCPVNENPVTYWTTISKFIGYDKISELGIKILGFPMSSAAVERSFSTIRHIHTWKRNSLTRDHLAKLVFVCYNRQFEKKHK